MEGYLSVREEWIAAIADRKEAIGCRMAGEGELILGHLLRGGWIWRS